MYLSNAVARAQVEDRQRKASGRAVAKRWAHPPSLARLKAASATARLARRLDAEAARRALA